MDVKEFLTDLGDAGLSSAPGGNTCIESNKTFIIIKLILKEPKYCPHRVGGLSPKSIIVMDKAEDTMTSGYGYTWVNPPSHPSQLISLGPEMPIIQVFNIQSLARK